MAETPGQAFAEALREEKDLHFSMFSGARESNMRWFKEATANRLAMGISPDDIVEQAGELLVCSLVRDTDTLIRRRGTCTQLAAPEGEATIAKTQKEKQEHQRRMMLINNSLGG